jgi:hypothetical protein
MEAVDSMIEDRAFINEKVMEEEDVDKLYYTHKVNAKKDDHLLAMMELLDRLEKNKPGTPFLTRHKNKLLLYAIRNNYFAYIYKDFSNYGLTINEISWTRSLHTEYLRVCKKILQLYHSNDFKSVRLDTDPRTMDAEKKADEAREKYNEVIRLNLGIRQEYNARKKLIESNIYYKECLANPQYGPKQYMKIALDHKYRVPYLSFSALKLSEKGRLRVFVGRNLTANP